MRSRNPLNSSFWELAIAWARSHQSQQTGFIHYCLEASPEGPHETIPFLLNLRFGRLLLQESDEETRGEGIALVERLLHFRIPKSSLFPRYLHAFPEAASQGHQRAIATAWREIGPYLPLFREEARLELKELLSSFPQERFQGRCDSASQWSRALALGLLSREEAEEHHDHLLAWADPETALYMGPLSSLSQEGSTPQPTLFEMATAWRYGTLPPWMNHPHPQWLSLPLVDFLPLVQSCSLVGRREGSTAFVRHRRYSYTTQIDSGEKASSPLRLLIPGVEPFFLACEGFSGKIGVDSSPKGVDLLLQIPHKEEEEKSMKGKNGVNLYFPRLSALSVGDTLQGKKATCFPLGEPLRIGLNQVVFSLKVTLEEGAGRCMAHLGHGNRPSQRFSNRKSTHGLYDWVFFVRMIEQHSPLVLRLSLAFHQPTELLQ